MRVATMVIALALMFLVGMQSCTVMVGGEMMDDSATSEGGAVGVLVAFLFLLGGAFSLGKPFVSMIVFALAALFGFGAGATSEFSDMSIWGGVSTILAVMSYFGHRGLQKAESIG